MGHSPRDVLTCRFWYTLYHKLIRPGVNRLLKWDVSLWRDTGMHPAGDRITISLYAYQN